jgi:hypothetical protein
LHYFFGIRSVDGQIKAIGLFYINLWILLKNWIKYYNARTKIIYFEFIRIVFFLILIMGSWDRRQVLVCCFKRVNNVCWRENISAQERYDTQQAWRHHPKDRGVTLSCLHWHFISPRFLNKMNCLFK